MKKINIIGSGFSSLAAACYLAKEGHEVHVFEKNEQLGGRAQVFKKDGFQFDMGPTWYWMPDVFEKFFADFGKKPSDYYQLERLDPGYKVYFEDGTNMDVPADLEALYELFEMEEKGSAAKLKTFLKEAQYNYEVGVQNLVYKPGLSPFELVTAQTVSKLKRFFTSIRSDVQGKFKSRKLNQLLEFPVLFLGAKPQDTPAFYNFMNHADLVLGTWYPKKGMGSVVEGMVDLGKSLGVQYHTNANIEKIIVKEGVAKGLVINKKINYADLVLSGADYHHTETLLDPQHRSYSESYWQKKVFAPSALLFYVGVDKKLSGVLHHTLFFDQSFDEHARSIYDLPEWPENPLFYASFPSITDAEVAPEGKESVCFLIPLAPDLEDTPALREKYFNLIIERFEKLTNQSVKPHILFNRSYCVNEFKKDYNSYKGNAYGMANTLRQTAFLRPKINSKKVANLFFTGQLTVPGPGVPPALISGKIAAEQMEKYMIKYAPYDVVV